MKFPGRRSKKHFFPIEERGRVPLDIDYVDGNKVYVVGLDQLLVDIEIPVEDLFLEKYDLPKGQSVVIDDDVADEIYHYFKNEKRIFGEFPGGAIGNTLHNYSVLSDGHSVALGSINRNITVGDYAYKYLVNTSSLVDLSYLSPSNKPMGRALCFITPDGERTFGISKGCMNHYPVESLPEDLISKSSALLVSAYTLRSSSDPIYKSTLRACELAKSAGVPVVLSLGTSSLVADIKNLLCEFIPSFVNVLAMNQEEAFQLTGINDPLLSIEFLLDWTDLVMETVGPKGLYIGGHVDERNARETKDELISKSIPEYNRFEYSRCMTRIDCKNPKKIYSHINPFMGGPSVIKNTNGAGDAALAAVLHDMASNAYHKLMMPDSAKHQSSFLTYSSIAQICKYANRVSYEVLRQSSPRLLRGLPQREAALEEAYWEK